ncbi:MAG: pyruvate synthase subunit PorA [Candidatus Hydrothermarchaeaceae archaeon]
MKDVIHGSRAVAEAARLCDVDVVPAYPITPQTHMVEDLAQMIANGELDAEYVKVESEHSAMSACIGASAAGARTFTATASQGLALMHEMLFVASGMRLPIVMANANRALSAPLSIWNDQQDSIAERDSGWIQHYCETAQEALDATVLAYKVSETREVSLPAMVCLDGFVLTHTIEPVDIPEKEIIDGFLPPFEPEFRLDPDNPMTMGAFADPSYYTEFRRQHEDAMAMAMAAIKKADSDYSRLTERRYGVVEGYNLEDARIVLVTMGSLAGTIKGVLHSMNGDVGLLRIRTYRPFPKDEIAEALSNAEVVSVVEKDVSIGLGEGALFTELKALFQGRRDERRVLGFIAGLGGRDVTSKDVEGVISKSMDASRGRKVDEVTWVGLKEASA